MFVSRINREAAIFLHFPSCWSDDVENKGEISIIALYLF